MPPPNPRRPKTLARGYSVALVAALLIVGGTLFWLNQPDPVAPLPPNATDVQRDLSQQPLNDVLAKYQFHSVATAEENGRTVVKLRVAPEGDEIVVDAATGRLIETRPHKPLLPVGKMPVPIMPTM